MKAIIRTASYWVDCPNSDCGEAQTRKDLGFVYRTEEIRFEEDELVSVNGETFKCKECGEEFTIEIKV